MIGYSESCDTGWGQIDDPRLPSNAEWTVERPIEVAGLVGDVMLM